MIFQFKADWIAYLLLCRECDWQNIIDTIMYKLGRMQTKRLWIVRPFQALDQSKFTPKSCRQPIVSHVDNLILQPTKQSLCNCNWGVNECNWHLYYIFASYSLASFLKLSLNSASKWYHIWQLSQGLICLAPRKQIMHHSFLFLLASRLGRFPFS